MIADRFAAEDNVVFRSAKERPFAERKATLRLSRVRIAELTISVPRNKMVLDAL
jgi:hypothetical protein